MLGDLDFNPGSSVSWLNLLASVSLIFKIKGLYKIISKGFSVSQILGFFYSFKYLLFHK